MPLATATRKISEIRRKVVNPEQLDFLQEDDVGIGLSDNLDHSLGPLLETLLLETIDVPGYHGETCRGLCSHQSRLQSRLKTWIIPRPRGWLGL